MAKYLYMCVEQCKEGNVLKNGTYSLDQHVIKGTYHLTIHTQKIMIKLYVESNFFFLWNESRHHARYILESINST